MAFMDMTDNGNTQQFELLDVITILSLFLDIDNRLVNNKEIKHQAHIEEEINDIHRKVDRILNLLEV